MYKRILIPFDASDTSRKALVEPAAHLTGFEVGTVPVLAVRHGQPAG